MRRPCGTGFQPVLEASNNRASLNFRTLTPPAWAGSPCPINVTRFSLPQFLRTVTLSALLWLAIAFACLFVGSTGWGWPDAAWKYRAEDVALASLIGAALAAAGVVYQAILRNPLADPYLLGVSSGATVASLLWRMPFTFGIPLVAATLSQQAFALIGALAAVAVVFALASRRLSWALWRLIAEALVL